MGAPMSKFMLTLFLLTPFAMAGSIYFGIPTKGRSRNATAPALAAPAPGKPAAQPVAKAKGVRPETLKQGYIIRVKDATGRASPDSPIYLAHSHNGWDPGSEKFKLQARSDMSWEIIMTPAAADSAMEFKFTRGSWETEELQDDMAVPGNRMLPEVDAKYLTNGEKPEFSFTIPRWGDQRPNVQARADVNPYYFLNVTGTVKRLEVVGGDAAPFKRDLLVWLPPGYDAPENKDRRYPVLYMNDGQNIFQKHPAIPAEWGVDEAATKLINEKAVEPLIIVGIPHAGKLRMVEYVPPTGGSSAGGAGEAGGERYINWVISTVMPRVERAFRVRTGPESTGIGGSSLGGLISLYAGSAHPEVFGKVLAESPSLNFGKADYGARFASGAAKWPGKVYLAVGGSELGAGKQEGSDRYAAAVKSLNQSLRSAGFGDDRRVFVFDQAAEHNEGAWANRFSAALRFLFPAQP
ncbi:MAG: alpha/beta hydrolase-fold protein [Phycisphaerales bacterium]|nr:alpha/beta hydrolase-fold protein [Phycisphaerales bacterium]